jgi:hypothetical protein
MHNKSGVFKHIKHDMLQGIVFSWPRFLPVVFIFLFICLPFFKGSEFAINQGISESPALFADCLVNAFQGMEVYIPSPDNKFSIPFTWLIINVYIAFLVGYYPMRDLSGLGKYMLLCSRKRRDWWIGKCIWTVSTVLAFYAIGYGVMLFSTLYHSGSLGSFQLSGFSVLGASPLSSMDLIVYVMLLPILTSITFSMLQLVLSLFFKPMMSFLAIIILIVASAYFFTPFLIGNSSMLLRSAAVLDNGIPSQVSFAIEAVLILGCLFIGGMKFKRYDILDKP